MKTKLNSKKQKIKDQYESLVAEAFNANEDMWNCLYDLHGESDGSLTLDTFDDSINDHNQKTSWLGFHFTGSLN